MANDEQLAILKNGVAEWNTWRAEHSRVSADLRGADLSGMDLIRANLHGADLRGTHLIRAVLSGTILSEANLHGAVLDGAYLWEANLSNANLNYSDLHGANLHRAVLDGAFLAQANLSDSNLRKANLSKAYLHGTVLHWADLSEADLTRAQLWDTVFGNTNLAGVKGLNRCVHLGPSVLDYRTLVTSRPLPLQFLRGVGLPDRLIEYLPSLLDEAIQFHACFISYSSQDQVFADRLYNDLQDSGVRCWFAPKSLKPGDYFRHEIDQAIRVYDKLLLILSQNSISSAWVADEVEAGLERERKTGQQILFPIQIDDAVTNAGDWAAALRRRRHIGDMRAWRDPDAYREAFSDFLNALRAEGAAPGPASQST